jgi:glycosyltransferase involved in cell wall biosynthesis
VSREVTDRTLATTLRIGIEVSAIREISTGVEVYIKHLVKHMPREAPESRFFLFANLQDVRDLRSALPRNCTVIPTALRWRPTRTLSHQIFVPLLARLLRLDLLHSTAFVIPLLSRSTPQLVTIHDMFFFSLPTPTRPPSDAALRRAILASLRRADGILVPSRATRAEIRRQMPEVHPDRIFVTPLGVSPCAAEPAVVEEVRARLGLPDRYLLFVGTLEPRKNLERLLRAFRAVAQTCDIELVLAGQEGWHMEPLNELLSTPGLRERVRLLGYVADRDLHALYSGAEAFLYPSIAEGFGLPPLEAMARGVPVLSSNRSSTAEILADAALLVDPESESEIRAGINRLIEDPALRRTLCEKGLDRASSFPWEETARKTLQAYEAVVKRGRSWAEPAEERRP